VKINQAFIKKPREKMEHQKFVKGGRDHHLLAICRTPSNGVYRSKRKAAGEVPLRLVPTNPGWDSYSHTCLQALLKDPSQGAGNCPSQKLLHPDTLVCKGLKPNSNYRMQKGNKLFQVTKIKRRAGLRDQEPEM